MPDNRERALDRLNKLTPKPSPYEEEVNAGLRLEAVAYAVLAVADELHELRDYIANVEDALEDQDGFGVGTHLRNVSDRLEQLAKR